MAVTDLLHNDQLMTPSWYCKTYDEIYNITKDIHGLQRLYVILCNIFQEFASSEPYGMFFYKVQRICETCIQVEYKFINPMRCKGKVVPRLHYAAAIYRIVHIYTTGKSLQEAFDAMKPPPKRKMWADMCESDEDAS